MIVRDGNRLSQQRDTDQCIVFTLQTEVSEELAWNPLTGRGGGGGVGMWKKMMNIPSIPSLTKFIASAPVPPALT